MGESRVVRRVWSRAARKVPIYSAGRGGGVSRVYVVFVCLFGTGEGLRTHSAQSIVANFLLETGIRAPPAAGPSSSSVVGSSPVGVVVVAAVVSPSVELYARDDDEPGFPSSGDRSEVGVSSTTPYSGMVDPAPAIVRLYRKMPKVEAERLLLGV